MRKKLQKIVASLLMVVMISTMFTTKAKAVTYDAEINKAVYNCVAIGDSIVELSDSYVRDILDDVESEYEKFTYTNLGVSGWTSADLLNALKNNESMRSSVKNADFIVLDIGGNDIFQNILSQMAASLGCSVSEIDSTMTSLMNQYNAATGFEKIYLGFQMMQIASDMHDKLYDENVIQKSADVFKVNYTSILKIVKELAPNAKVYVANQYNPCMDSTTQYLGYVEIGNAYDIVELYDAKYNNIIATSSAGCTVVDVHSVITEAEDIIGTFESGNFDPHPSAVGYGKAIEAFLAKMM